MCLPLGLPSRAQRYVQTAKPLELKTLNELESLL